MNNTQIYLLYDDFFTSFNKLKIISFQKLHKKLNTENHKLKNGYLNIVTNIIKYIKQKLKTIILYMLFIEF